MKQWDIFLFPFDMEKRHPVVILSNDETCQNSDIEEVNGLLCTSVRLGRGPKPTEEVLDESDGLDWKTAVRCDKIHLLPKDGFQEQRGTVTRERRHLDRPQARGSVAAAGLSLVAAGSGSSLAATIEFNHEWTQRGLWPQPNRGTS